MIMTSEQAQPEILRAARDGVWISDDVAQTIAAGLMTPAAVDAPLTALAHGLPFDAHALLKRVHRLTETEFKASPVLLELEALIDWTWQRLPHVEVSTVTLPTDEYYQREEFAPEEFRVERFIVEDYRDSHGEHYEAGDPGYPADVTGLEVQRDGSVFVPAGVEFTASRMLLGLGTQFWASEYSGEAGDIGGEFQDQPYDNPVDGKTSRKTARLVGFTPDQEREVHARWAKV